MVYAFVYIFKIKMLMCDLCIKVKFFSLRSFLHSIRMCLDILAFVLSNSPMWLNSCLGLVSGIVELLWIVYILCRREYLSRHDFGFLDPL